MNGHPITPKRIALLSIAERADKSLLPDELLIKDIGELRFKDKQERYSFYAGVVKAYKEKRLKCKSIGTYMLPSLNAETYALLNGTKESIEAFNKEIEGGCYSILDPPEWLIHRDDMKAYFQSINLWPVKNCLLANWWPQTEQQAETVYINWDDWLNREEITIDDALWLSMPTPINPPGIGFPETSLFDDNYTERREIAESWISSGQLPYKIKREEKDRDYYTKPLCFFRLARDIGWLNLLNPEHDAIHEFLEKNKTELNVQFFRNNNISNAPEPIAPLLTGSRHVHKSSIIPLADYETWSKADLWTIERGILLLLNAETLPSRRTSTGRCKSDEEQRLYDDFIKIWAVAESSLKTGLLKKTDKSYPSFASEVVPSDFIYWATAKGYSIPIELKSINVITQAEHMGINGVGSLDERQDFQGGMMGFNFSFAEAQNFPAKARKLEALNISGFAEAYDETAPKITRLTKYLELDTWTPEEAAFLVCGIDADYLLGQTLDKATSLADGTICNSNDFLCAERVLKLWNSQENPPAKVRPVVFVAWCKTKNIDTGWITNADEWPGYVLSHTESLSNNVPVRQVATERASAKVIQFNSNELDFSGLLNAPAKKDDWFNVIDDMTKAFFSEYRKIPNEAQAWGRFCTVPPEGYAISIGTDKGEDCLNMPGAKPLSKSAFSKRWAKYTANKT